MEERIALTKAPLLGVVTDKGAVGKPNEDAYGYFKLGPGQWTDEPNQSIYVALVADGVTSKAGGAKASEIAVNTITYTLQAKAPMLMTGVADALRQDVEEAILRANEEIRKVARQTPEWSGMSTTLVLAVLAGRQLSIAHLGDSRAYVIRGRQIHRLTVDHTWVQEALDQQQISEAEAKIHPNRNVIQRYLGIRDHIEIDHRTVAPGTYLRGPQRDYVDSILLEPGDVILLCSDGQVEKVSDQEMLAAIKANQDRPQKAAEKLIQLALAQKEHDNITSLLLALPSNGAAAVNYMRWGLSLAAVFILAAFLIWFSGVVHVTSQDSPTPVSQAMASIITPTITATPVKVNVASVVTATASILANTPISLPSATAKATAKPQAMVTQTATSSATPRPTNKPTTSTPMPTSTTMPTSTPIPTRAATATSTATPKQSATAASTRPASSTATATSAKAKPAASVPASNLSVQLVLPPDPDSGQGERTFTWLADFQLAPDQFFEVVFWKEGQAPFGIVSPTKNTQVTVNLNQLYDNGLLKKGAYKWGVLLVKTTPYTRIQSLSGGNRFSFEPITEQKDKSSPGTSGEKER